LPSSLDGSGAPALLWACAAPATHSSQESTNEEQRILKAIT